jgi:hypothetical protein
MNAPRPSNYTPFSSKANIFQTLWAIDKRRERKKRAIVELLATRPTNTNTNENLPTIPLKIHHHSASGKHIKSFPHSEQR